MKLIFQATQHWRAILGDKIEEHEYLYAKFSCMVKTTPTVLYLSSLHFTLIPKDIDDESIEVTTTLAVSFFFTLSRTPQHGKWQFTCRFMSLNRGASESSGGLPTSFNLGDSLTIPLSFPLLLSSYYFRWLFLKFNNLFPPFLPSALLFPSLSPSVLRVVSHQTDPC